ncbi:hypothetical protein LJ737_21485 [Hymenobacter sp. 15J16-1T3B]|uniref:LVIVD repeat-containing protein n=1 Tax=Hymenobacter sp. 15J16-1T3B TaxID=2886941 RepID=UPI001D0FEEB2|nr:hypothetical protein [Hymenobacter sp. 15J16-1T3B]MCC3159829.1 hypothetical protein [Hymenobacter sp. 15J16-1T3B]
MRNLFSWPGRVVVLLLLLALLPGRGAAQNVGINTTQPTQTLDVNGGLRVRGLSGAGDSRLVTVQPDGTLGLTPSFYNAQATGDLPGLLGAPTTLGESPVWAETRGSLLYELGISMSGAGGLVKIYNVSNAGAPALLSTLATGTIVYKMALNGAGNMLVVISSSGGRMQLIDVSNPAAPALLNTYSIGSNPRGLAMQGNTAFVLSGNLSTPTLRVFDLSNPAAATPLLLATIPTASAGEAVALNAAGTRAYVAEYGSGSTGQIEAFDISTLASPTSLGTVTMSGYATKIVLEGTRAYAVSSNILYAYDLTGPAGVASLGSLNTGSAGPAINLTVHNGLAYLMNLRALTVVDLSNPAALSQVSQVVLPPAGNVQGDVVRVGSSVFLLRTIDATLRTGELREYQLVQAGPPRLVTVNADGTLASLPTPTLSLSGQTLSISGGNAVTLPSTGDNLGNGVATSAVRLPEQDLYLRAGTATDDGLGRYGSGRLWAGQAIDGPVLYGHGGGALGGRAGGAATTALRWAADGNVALGSAAPLVRLDVDGALALRPAAPVALTANNQAVTVGNSSYLRLTSDNNSPGQRVAVLSAGLVPGQMLLLENAGSTGSFSLEEGASVELTGTSVALGPADVLQLVWTGAKWLQLSFSNN